MGVAEAPPEPVPLGPASEGERLRAVHLARGVRRIMAYLRKYVSGQLTRDSPSGEKQRNDRPPQAEVPLEMGSEDEEVSHQHAGRHMWGGRTWLGQRKVVHA